MFHARIGNDRYLHFPAGFQRKNEFLMWAINASSDGESDVESETQYNNQNSFLAIEYKDDRKLNLSDNNRLNKKENTSITTKSLFENPNNSSKKKTPCDELSNLNLEDWINLKAEEAGISFTTKYSMIF